jgi:SAM-dependent methyltransferase
MSGPSYPPEGVAWMVGPRPARVLELAAGTGRLTEQLDALGHRVIATDPSEPMLRQLTARAPRAYAVAAAAEQLPVAARSVDAVVAAQPFDWPDQPRALAEVARVLRPRGVLAVVRNSLDDRVPWVRRLAAIIDEPTDHTGPDGVAAESGLFGTVEAAEFRFWQPLTQESLRDLVRARPGIAALAEREREPVLHKVDELYDEYGRGADGMLMPYLTRTFRATVLPGAQPDPGPMAVGPDEVDTDALLIDFR